MNPSEKVKAILASIGLALHASHNVVATDDPSVDPDEKSWRIDHTAEIAALEQLETALNSIGICPECGCRNTCPLTPQLGALQKLTEEPGRNHTSSLV